MVDMAGIMAKSPGVRPVASDTSVDARDSRIYVFRGYNETVIAANGTILWNVENVPAPGAVDDQGNLYLMNAILPYSATDKHLVDQFSSIYLEDCRIPGSVVDSYYPNGTLRWQQYSDDLARPNDEQGPLPLYHKGILYVAGEKSVTAISDNGTLLWVKPLNKDDYPFTINDSWYDEFYPAVPATSYPPNALQGGTFTVYSMPFDRQVTCTSNIRSTIIARCHRLRT
jgi:hypothetical protein